MENNIQDKISMVAREISKGGNNVVFTGAGISTESGISDFRKKRGRILNINFLKPTVNN